MFDPIYVKRLNTFLDRYADHLETRGAIEKAVAVRMETIPIILQRAAR